MRCGHCLLDTTSIMIGDLSDCPNCKTPYITVGEGARVEEYPDATSLTIKNIFADISFWAERRMGFHVTVEGHDEPKEALMGSVRDDGLLTLVGILPELRMSRVGDGMVQIGSRIIFNGVTLDPSKKLKITIRIPWETTVNLSSGTFGSALFEHDGGDLTFNNSGLMDVVMGSWDRLVATIDGVNSLDVGDVHQLDLGVRGTGDAKIRSATVSMRITCSSVGEAVIDSVAGESDIVVSGTGDVIIGSISGNLGAEVKSVGSLRIGKTHVDTAVFTVKGVGDVKIKGGNINALTVKTSSVGGVKFDGHAATGDFSNSGIGDIKVKSCQTVINRRSSSIGRIKIG
jgi:hypothetical protein